MPQFAPFETEFAHTIYRGKYPLNDKEDWYGTADRVVSSVVPSLLHSRFGGAYDVNPLMERLFSRVRERQFIPGGRYLYAAGRDFHQVNNCLLLRPDDSREGWSDLQYHATMALMTGAGIGGYYGDLRPAGSLVKKTGGEASGPVPLMRMVNETGREVMQGGARRSAIWAGLPWWHPDIFDFIRAKDWPEWLREQKAKDWTVAAPLDMTNISVCLDDHFFAAYNGGADDFSCVSDYGQLPSGPAPSGCSWRDWAHAVYNKTIEKMVTTGEPGFSVDTGDKRDEVLRNACTEITSADDSDVCNLGSLVLPRFESVKEFGKAVRDAVAFLTAGSLYSDVPYGKVAEIREKNRRLGLGLIGVHEFVLMRGAKYGTDDSFEVLEPYMAEYRRALEYAHELQDSLGLSLSKGATAIAPNGTIGIVAESTPSGDPLFSAARKRVLRIAGPRGDTHEEHVVIDPVALRMVARGVNPADIEDAYSLAMFPERRLAMQAYLQKQVDHAVSSTVNLPYPITKAWEQRQFGDTLMQYLPQLRGVTAYPDGARSGQPLKAVPLEWALEHEGEVTYSTEEETCNGGVCGV